MAVQKRDAAAQAAADLDARVPELAVEPPAGPGFATLWGGHIGVIAAGIVAMAAAWL